MKRSLGETKKRGVTIRVTRDRFEVAEEDCSILGLEPGSQDIILDRTHQWRPDLTKTSDSKLEFDEALLWMNLQQGRHLLISGKAGAGKSHLLKRLMSHMPSDVKVVLTAFAAIAAFNVGGQTLHSALGLGLASEPCTQLFEKIKRSKFRFKKTWNFLQTTDLLIIDEISMVPPEFWTKLDYLFRQARDEPSKAFGGCQLIMLGDFTQLGPIHSNSYVQRQYEDPTLANFVFQTESWTTLKLTRLFLDRSYRQEEGPFLDLLSALRVGILTREHQDLLRSRTNQPPVIIQTSDEQEQYTIEPINIYPHKWKVYQHNQKKLKALCETKGIPARTYSPGMTVTAREGVRENRMKPGDINRAQALLDDRKRCRQRLEKKFPCYEVKVCVGAQVMMRCNKYKDLNIFNGSFGIVTGMTDDTLEILFVVRGQFREASLTVHRHEFRDPIGETVDLVMHQFPITLAWASTIHKVQGCTLDSMQLDASQCFEAGQLYVALSRVRELQHLCLLDFQPESLLINDAAVTFEKALQDSVSSSPAQKRLKTVA